MNLHAIFHLPDSNYAYAYDKETLHIRLRTAKNDIDKVTLRAGDPYHWASGGGGGNLNAEGAMGWVCEDILMQKEASTELFDFWIAEVKPPYRRARYGFLLDADEEKFFYGEAGIFDISGSDTKNILGNIGNYFCHPFLNTADVFITPEWAKMTIWYQIFPERFANGDPALNPEGCFEWGSRDPKWDSFFGGDIQGMIDRLDYLVDLGINGIYLCPIFKAPSTHKYDTEDYFEIDPQFGTKETFKRFVDLAHEKGIRIMLDLVVNHCGYTFAPWQDVLEYGDASKYKDWFHIHGFPVARLEEEGWPNYDAFAFVKSMPKMKTENPEVRDYYINVARYWTSEFNIDGWRLDVANEVDHVFWREFRKAMRLIRDDIYILGEVWHDANPWLKGDQFDAVMNYPLTSAINDFIAKNDSTASEFKEAISRIQTMYSQNATEVNLNLLDSHDTARLLTTCGDDKRKVLLAYSFLMTLAGTPSIYYGDEIGMDGENDPLCRKCMVWDKEQQDLEMFASFKEIIALRKTHAALRSTQLEWLAVNDDENYILFKKSAAGEDIYLVLNNSDLTRTVDLSSMPPKIYTDLLTNEKVDATKGLQVDAYSLVLLV